jgi:hypothetical protein
MYSGEIRKSYPTYLGKFGISQISAHEKQDRHPPPPEVNVSFGTTSNSMLREFKLYVYYILQVGQVGV